MATKTGYLRAAGDRYNFRRRVPSHLQAYFEREVLPHVPDAWIDETKMRKGYEIPFTRHFYRYVPPRPLAEIDADLKRLSADLQIMWRDIAA